jgi:hypothetical protein
VEGTSIRLVAAGSAGMARGASLIAADEPPAIDCEAVSPVGD